MITWPAIIKYSGDHELVYVPDQIAWNLNSDLYAYRFEAGDLLIDSDGLSYDLTDVTEVDLLSSNRCLSLSELTELVRFHASELGNCCISKLVFPSMSAAIEGVGSIKDEQ